MIERELEVIDRVTEEASDIAVALADVRDAVEGTSAHEMKEALSVIVERINSVADVLTALSIDLAKLDNTLDRKNISGEDTNDKI